MAVIAVYLAGIVALGCWAGLRKRKGAAGDGYFLAGRSLGWPVIGMALFATNISTIHLVSLAQEGYTNGLAYGNFEWMAGFTLILLALFFAPFYVRSRVATLPDFLERRYSRASRGWLSLISIVAAISSTSVSPSTRGRWCLRGCLASTRRPASSPSPCSRGRTPLSAA